jgi:hypothetical protein
LYDSNDTTFWKEYRDIKGQELLIVRESEQGLTADPDGFYPILPYVKKFEC